MIKNQNSGINVTTHVPPSHFNEASRGWTFRGLLHEMLPDRQRNLLPGGLVANAGACIPTCESPP